MRVAYDLVAKPSAKHSARDDVAGPVLVEIDARDAGNERGCVQQRCGDFQGTWLTHSHLTNERSRRRERHRRVHRWVGAVIELGEAAAEFEAERVERVGE